MNMQDILKTEYSETFDSLRKKMMVTSFHKYGPLQKNADNPQYDFIASLEKRYAKFRETGNVEYLADVANFCMMIFMYPESCGCFYRPTDSDGSPGIVGVSVGDVSNV